MIEIWVMDSECCSTCGAILDVGEWDQCDFCYENARYDEERALYDSWFDFDEDEPEQEATIKREHEIALREGGYFICFPEKEAGA